MAGPKRKDSVLNHAFRAARQSCLATSSPASPGLAHKTSSDRSHCARLDDTSV